MQITMQKKKKKKKKNETKGKGFKILTPKQML